MLISNTEEETERGREGGRDGGSREGRGGEEEEGEVFQKKKHPTLQVHDIARARRV